MQVDKTIDTDVLAIGSGGAALARRESRGSHFRGDYPQLDDRNWRVNVLFRMEEGRLHQETGRLAE